MNLKQWAERQGVSYATARRWFAAGTLPVQARRVGGLVLVGETPGPGNAGIAAVYARVSSAGQKADLDRQVARVAAEYVEAALAASGRGLLVVDPAEVDDDLLRDVTEILTSLCARRYGRRAAADRAARAVAAATAGDEP